ncbi:lysylphosphatidylglycerol synthase transmembrane domain-containing protein [Bacteroidota bacterium]
MRKKLINTLKYIGFLAVGIFLFWLIYRDLEKDKLLNELFNLNYWWLVLSFTVGILSHISRAIRWNMLIKPLGYKPRIINTFLAVMVMYLVNLALPRAGEIARCSVLTRYEKVPFTKLVGTVVVERTSDVIALLFFAFVIVLTQIGVFKEFLVSNPESQEKFIAIFSTRNIIIGIFIILGIILSFYIFRKNFIKTKFYKKIAGYVESFTEGIKAILKLENKWHYIGHTIFIYIIWFVALYLIFFSFKPTAHLSISAAAVALVMGALAMTAPVQGGIGPWHFMIIEALFIYGIDKADGEIFALVAHAANNLSLMFMGAIGLIILPIINRNYEAKALEEN